MTEFASIVVAFVMLGAYVFWLCRAWHRHLTYLAQSTELAQRRRRAGYQYPFVVLLFIAPSLSVVIWAARYIHAIHAPKVLLAVFLISSLAPGFTWWAHRWKSLEALGYGRAK
jgi:hypothetical protein